MKVGDYLIALKDISKPVYKIWLNQYNVAAKHEYIGLLSIKKGERILITNLTDKLIEIENNNVRVYFSLNPNIKNHEFYGLYFKESEKVNRLKKLQKINKKIRTDKLKNLFSS